MANDPTDPLNTHSTKGQQGPFVQNSTGGFLSRLLRGGSGDPAAPPPEPATNTIPTTTASTTSDGRDRFGRPKGNTTMAPYARPETTTQRNPLMRIASWLFRIFGFRIVVALVALVLVIIGNVYGDGNTSDETSENLRGMQERLEAMKDKTGAPQQGTQGRLDVAVVGVGDGNARLIDRASGTTYEWILRDDAVGQTLLDNGFRQVTVYWRLDPQGAVQVVGVEGPNASVRPDSGVVSPGTAATT